VRRLVPATACHGQQSDLLSSFDGVERAACWRGKKVTMRASPECKPNNWPMLGARVPLCKVVRGPQTSDLIHSGKDHEHDDKPEAAR
jgi:hypothetical protein